MKIGKVLHHDRVFDGLGVRTLAEQIGTGYSTLSRLENREEPTGRQRSCGGC